MDTRAGARMVWWFAAALAVAGCGGGGGGGGGSASPPPGAPTPVPPPPPASGTITITLHNNTTASDVASGSIYGRAGDRVYGRAELGVGDLLCTFQTGSRTCTVEINAGQVLTLAGIEITEAKMGQIPIGGFTDPNWFKQLPQWVSWSAPCTAPELGVCALQPASNQDVTVLWKPMAITTIGFQGLREWRVRVDARPLMAIGSVHTGLRQQHSYEYPAQPVMRTLCTGGPTPIFCEVIPSPDDAQITMEYLPSIYSSPPMGATTLLQPMGFGGGCSSASAAGGCTLTALGEQSAWFKWEYYVCFNAANEPSYGNGLSGWKYQQTPQNCALQSP